MKIIPHQQPAGVSSEPRGLDKKTPAGEGSFGKVFDEAVQAQPTHAVKTSMPMAIQRPPVATIDRQVGIEEVNTQIDDSLAALDAYRDALADPEMNLREISPLLDTLEASGRQLDEQLAGLSSDADAPLRQIGAETSALIVAEKARFYSGTYN